MVRDYKEEERERETRVRQTVGKGNLVRLGRGKNAGEGSGTKRQNVGQLSECE